MRPLCERLNPEAAPSPQDVGILLDTAPAEYAQQDWYSPVRPATRVRNAASGVTPCDESGLDPACVRHLGDGGILRRGSAHHTEGIEYFRDASKEQPSSTSRSPLVSIGAVLDASGLSCGLSWASSWRRTSQGNGEALATRAAPIGYAPERRRAPREHEGASSRTYVQSGSRERDRCRVDRILDHEFPRRLPRQQAKDATLMQASEAQRRRGSATSERSKIQTRERRRLPTREHAHALTPPVAGSEGVTGAACGSTGASDSVSVTSR